MASDQACYTLIADADDSEAPPEMELRQQLEKGKIPEKVAALKKVITQLLKGEKMPTLLMTIIRFVMPCDDHSLKKLLLIYWEIAPKYGPDGKLLHEMILVCDAYRKDILHKNEYVRGATLRFLCKLKEPELLEPLMPAIQECLNHHQAYVRRNAVLAIYTIYKNFEHLIPDAPETIQRFLEQESDASCKRNAFMMLTAADQSRALDYVSTCIDQVHTFNEILQLVIVELVHKVCRTDATQRSRFIRCIHNLLTSSSAAVRYDAAAALITISSAPTAISAAAKCYTDLIVKESDNNVKLIVLDKLAALKDNPQHERILQNLVMDVLRVLAAPDLTVRKKTLDLVLELISSRNAAEIVAFLKKELAKTTGQEEFEKTAEYRQLLIRSLHACGVRFPELAPTIVPQLMEFLSDASASSGMDVILFVREAFERLPELRTDMLNKLFECFLDIKAPKVMRATLWIIGEYCKSTPDLEAALAKVSAAIGALPIVDVELKEAAETKESTEAAPEEPKVVSRTRITADGTYATESIYTSAAKVIKADKPALRKILLEGDFFVATSLATTLTKLALRANAAGGLDSARRNAFTAQAMFIMASVVHLGRSGLAAVAMDEDSRDRVMLCLQVLSQPSAELVDVFERRCHASFAKMLEEMRAQVDATKKTKPTHTNQGQADDLISFRALRNVEEEGKEDEFELSVTRATGSDQVDKATSVLSKVFQLSGFSDPVYAEAYVHVNQYDILLDVLVVNQTSDTLQNLTLELATLGDLKLTEKPQSHTLGPRDFCNIKANVKVSSTETGIIFGNIVYDITGSGAGRNCVVLNDIHIDIMDYITPAFCSDVDFRTMWSEFEWENKVAVRTAIPELREYLDHLLKTTNMRCLTPASALAGDCDFLAANLYAKSVFGEDALANVSIEKLADGQVTGHVRIRSKTSGLALSLGDKITLNQKEGLANL